MTPRINPSGRWETAAERLDLGDTDRRTVAFGGSEPDPTEPGSLSLEELTPAERSVFIAVEWNGYAPAQVARATDRAPSTARTLLARARRKMGVSV
jgi:DNA-directed RNA polymerase specialized sigma24 family protein